MASQCSKPRSITRSISGKLILIHLLIASEPISGYQALQRLEPISEERLVALLTLRTAFPKIIEAVNERGVSFQTFQPFINEIKDAGKYLGSSQLNLLLATVSNNYRPSEPPRYRVTYSSLKGVAANLLLDKNIPKDWNDILGDKKYSVTPNEVLRTLSGLMTRFSSRNYRQHYFGGESSENGPLDDDSKLARLYRIRRKPLFVGSTGEPNGDGEAVYPGTADVAGLISSLNDQNKQWRLVDIQQDPVPPKKGKSPTDLYTFRKFLEKGELRLFAGTKLAAFYSYLTKNYFPPDFAAIELETERIDDSQEDEDCAGPEKYGPLDSTASLIGPLLSLNVAIVENISEKPITTGRLFVKINKAETLRTREQDNATLNAAPFQSVPLFASGVLKPGEKVIIPIDLSLTNDDWDHWDTPSESADDPVKFADELARLRKVGGLRFPGVRPRLSLPTAAIEGMLRRPKIDFSETPEYLYGPSLRLEAVEINSGGDLVRHFDPTRLNITPEGELVGGSCPYIYSYNSATARWMNQGTILVGKSAKAKESMDETPLRSFDGRLLIRERDPEESFIDLVQIRAKLADGSSIILRAKDLRLRNADGNYLQLRQNQQMEIAFEIPVGFVAEKYYVISSGYYLPSNKKTSVSRNLQTHVSLQRFSRHIRAWR